MEPVDGDGDTSSGPESLPKDHESSSVNDSDSNSRTGSSRTGNTTDDDINMIKEELAREETKNVFRLRILVILILVATAIAMSYTIYHITHQAEIDEFESEFEGVADTIIASLNGTYKDMVVFVSFSDSTAVVTYPPAFCELVHFRCRETDVCGGWPRRNGNCRSSRVAIRDIGRLSKASQQCEISVWNNISQHESHCQKGRACRLGIVCPTKQC
jgi:hypothetical protein